MAEVTLEDVKKVYDGKVLAVRDVNLRIADGEFVVLVGPSGCGKSTTLRMIAGLEEITDGLVHIGDRVVNNVHPKDRDIAMVFQNYALYPHMSVFKNMAFGLTLRRMPRDEIRRRVDQAARILGISELLMRKPKQLSGGQRQRVALGRAIVRDPAVFLFDEPLSNLDAKLRVTTRTEIKALHKRLQTTTVYVTHDQEEAMTLGDRIVVMSAGRGTGIVEQVDTPLNVFRRPANRFVGAFLGLPPMNFIVGELRREDAGIYFVSERDNVRILLPPDHNANLDAHLNTPVSLGIRPQGLAEQPVGPFAGRDNSITIRSDIIETLGKSIDVSTTLPSGRHFIGRIDAREDFPVGESVTLYMDMQHVHVFEPGDFGRNLLHPPDPETSPAVNLGDTVAA
jgi:multiple sugar transport system ATP-binding protein